jgi:hypothetical protein
LARRATYLDEVFNSGNPVLLVDGGDLFGRRQNQDKEQTKFLCEVTGSFGWDAIGLGEYDLNYGLEFLLEMIKTYDLPFTSANVRNTVTQELILPPYLIIERGGIRFGIIAVLDPGMTIETMSPKDPPFEASDPIATLRALIPQVRQEADTILLLSHLGDRGSENLLREVEGIDIAVIGHNYRKWDQERVIGDTVVLSAVYEGRYMGRADLGIDTDGIVQSVEVEVTALDEKVADDPVMLEKVEQFKKHLEEYRLSLRAKYPQVKGSEHEKFLTERSCKVCHQDVWEVLKGSAHQRAFTSLGKKGQAFNPDCLVCHVVGYEYKNGYDDRPPNNRLVNVQCEACHGYGTMHRRDGKWKQEATKACVTCHDEENSPNFDYAVYWEKIKH